MAERVTIARLGAKADGLAEMGGRPVFVPYALPGEAVTIERDGERARLVAVETPSPEREQPFCPYFGVCGGCATQHMRHGFYQGWKRGNVVEALRRARIEAPVAALVDAHGAGRRRITLHARVSRGNDARRLYGGAQPRRGGHRVLPDRRARPDGARAGDRPCARRTPGARAQAARHPDHRH